MCGIFAVHSLPNPAADRSRFIALSKRQRHRGPDWSGCYVGQRTVLVHERLAVVGVGNIDPIRIRHCLDRMTFWSRYRRTASL